MKELLTVRSNLLAAITEEKKLLPQAEIVLVMSEPIYTVDATGEIVRQRETSHCRFMMSPQTLRLLATAFNELAAESESLTEANDSKP